MKHPGALIYAIFSQIVTFGSLIYFSLWLHRTGVAKTIDSGVPGDPVVALTVDTLLLTIFCSLHSLLARSSVKKVMRRYVPQSLERATYCLFFGFALLALCLLWQPLPRVVWNITSPAGVTTMVALFILFWAAHYAAMIWMGYAEFWGLRQAWFAARGEEYRPPTPMTKRDFAASHILLIVSLMLIPWATPRMSWGQLYFCVFLVVYDVIGAWLSARDFSDVPAPVETGTGRVEPSLVP